jgi:hypothetical protein
MTCRLSTSSVKVPKLPIEIMDEIVLYTCDIQIAFILKHHISQYVFDNINKKFLIFGDLHRSRASARQGDIHSSRASARQGDIHSSRASARQGDIHSSRASARQGDLDIQTGKTKIIKNTFKKFWLSRKNIKKDTFN